MIIKIHRHNELEENSIWLAFIKSLNVSVYPCGRRRSTLIDADMSGGTIDDRYYIPFDPEARLNTEFNNRRHTSINGFKQSFITSWDEENALFSFVIGGYSFSLSLNDKLTSSNDLINDFGTEVIKEITNISKENIDKFDKIYANIKLEEIPLYTRDDGSLKYNTWILRNQSGSDLALTSLDLPYSVNISKDDSFSRNSNTDEYYFSGLSFSTEPITEKLLDEVTNKALTYSDKYITSGIRPQQEISLCILAKNAEGLWRPYEPAKLPYVEHGATENSVEVIHLNAESIRYNEHPVAVFDINKLDNTNFYQLHLYNALPTT